VNENGELEFRAAQVASVSFPQRIVELIVMPYETETLIAERGKVFTEIVSRGAFAGIESRNGRVRVNRDHQVTRTVGRAVAFHPSRTEGLVAEVKISDTDLGRETLTLADDGCLDASAGFRPLLDKEGRMMANAEVWETRSRRRLNRLYLGHIALTPEAAYESAKVLAVRQKGVPEPAAVATPNRDRLDLDRWRELVSVIDARYGVTQH
jgi:phage head maturation protease